MYKLLIEDVAAALGKDPKQLEDLELRKFCILIDWTLTLLTYVPGKSSTPLFNGNLHLKADLTGTLANIIKTDNFPELDLHHPDCELMDKMFERLGHHLGYSNDTIHNIETGFISDYENHLVSNGLVYTNYLIYKRKLTSQEWEALNNIQHELGQQFPQLPWLNHQSLFEFNPYECSIKVGHFFDQMPFDFDLSMKANFCIHLLNRLLSFQKKFKRSISESSLFGICQYLDNLQPSLPALSQIEQGLTQLILLTKQSPIVDKLRQILSVYLSRFPRLRDWKNLNDLAPNPIHRVILLGYQDIADEEIIRVVNLLYRKHPHENIAVTFNPEDVLKVNNPFTLQVIGHGTVEGENTMNANLGPFRGDARITGKQVAELVNHCPHIKHLRLYSCFSGKLNNTNLHRLTEHQRSPEHTSAHIRRKLTMMLDGNLTPDNNPFVDYAPAVSCWNAINKEGRDIRMTVSPGIIEPEEALGCMVWKPSTFEEGFATGIKDICIAKSNYLPLKKSKTEPAPRTVQNLCRDLTQLNLTVAQPKLF